MQKPETGNGQKQDKRTTQNLDTLGRPPPPFDKRKIPNKSSSGFLRQTQKLEILRTLESWKYYALVRTFPRIH